MNITRFKRVLDFIRDNPGHWNQLNPVPDFGPCCFLAHAALMSKRKRMEPTFTDVGASWLGLTRTENDWVFSTNRTIRDFQNFLRRHQRRKAA